MMRYNLLFAGIIWIGSAVLSGFLGENPNVLPEAEVLVNLSLVVALYFVFRFISEYEGVFSTAGNAGIIFIIFMIVGRIDGGLIDLAYNLNLVQPLPNYPEISFPDTKLILEHTVYFAASLTTLSFLAYICTRDCEYLIMSIPHSFWMLSTIGIIFSLNEILLWIVVSMMFLYVHRTLIKNESVKHNYGSTRSVIFITLTCIAPIYVVSLSTILRPIFF